MRVIFGQSPSLLKVNIESLTPITIRLPKPKNNVGYPNRLIVGRRRPIVSAGVNVGNIDGR